MGDEVEWLRLLTLFALSFSHTLRKQKWKPGLSIPVQTPIVSDLIQRNKSIRNLYLGPRWICSYCDWRSSTDDHRYRLPVGRKASHGHATHLISLGSVHECWDYSEGSLRTWCKTLLESTGLHWLWIKSQGSFTLLWPIIGILVIHAFTQSFPKLLF